MAYKPWEDTELKKLSDLRASGLSWDEVAEGMGRTRESCRFMWRRLNGMAKVTYIVKESPYQRFDAPLVREGDALILSDVEAPFHHAEFMNKCIELAIKWKVKTCILAGDFMHFDSISSWEPAWTNPPKTGLNDAQERVLMDFLQTLPGKYQASMPALLEALDGTEENVSNISAEMRAARQVVEALSSSFKNIDFVIGNHEGRLLRAFQSPVCPEDVLRLIDAESWRIAPYYWMHLKSGGRTYQIEHPGAAARTTAARLAAKYQVDVIMGHSHLLEFRMDASGQHYAITAGHCVDELRLPYSSQRHRPGDAHNLGAVIVRDGYPWLLHNGCDFARLMKM